MVESYKYKSKIATAIAFIAMFIVYLGKDGLSQFIPEEYAFLIPILVFAAGYVLAQSTEDKRVKVAELLVHDKYNQTEEVDPTAEYQDESYPEVGDDDDGCWIHLHTWRTNSRYLT